MSTLILASGERSNGGNDGARDFTQIDGLVRISCNGRKGRSGRGLEMSLGGRDREGPYMKGG